MKTKQEIHRVRLLCCVCQGVALVDAIPGDPIDAFEIRGTACTKCDHGGWDSPTYHREDGSEILDNFTAPRFHASA